MSEKKCNWSIKICLSLVFCLFVFALLSFVGSVPAAKAQGAGLYEFAKGETVTAGLEAITKNCTCVAAKGGWNSGIVYNYGVIATYPLLDVMAPSKCSKKCSDLVSGKDSIGDATAMCATTGWSGGCVRGYGYIGATGTNNADGTAGKLVCTAPIAGVTKEKCPAGWYCNGCSPQTDGGFASDGKCKKATQCGGGAGINIFPLPPDGTQIGTWGFTWGNGIYAWGTAANGGAPSTIIISPAVPGSGSWSTCP